MREQNFVVNAPRPWLPHPLPDPKGRQRYAQDADIKIEPVSSFVFNAARLCQPGLPANPHPRRQQHCAPDVVMQMNLASGFALNVAHHFKCRCRLSLSILRYDR